MLVGVPRGGQRPQRQPAQVDLVGVAQATMVEPAPAGRRGQHHRTVGGGKLAGAGQEVGVQVRVGGERDGHTAPGGGGPQRPQVPRRVHRQGPAVAEVEQVGAVAQALIDQRDHLIRFDTHHNPHSTSGEVMRSAAII